MGDMRALEKMPRSPERELTKNEKKVIRNLEELQAWLKKYLQDEGVPLQEGYDDSDLERRYFPEFDREFRTLDRAVSEEELLGKIVQAEVVYFGDEHSLRKNQQYVAEIVTQMAQKLGVKPVLALELVRKKNQKDLEAFLAGQMEEEDFRRKIRFSRRSDNEHWEGYRAILEVAWENGLAVFGLEENKTKRSANETVDRTFAKNLAKIAQQDPHRPLVVHIGDAHLAEKHLPEKVANLPEFSGKSTVRIFQNFPAIYFSALKRFAGFHLPKIVHLQKDAYHVQTAPLLTRLLADIEYVQYEQEQSAVRNEEDDVNMGAFWSESLGPEIVARLGRFLNLLVDPEESLNFYMTKGEIEDFLDESKKSISPDTLKRTWVELEQRGCVYLSAFNAMLVSRFRLKYVLEEIARFVWHQGSLNGEPDKAFQFFCSKLFIPEREPQTGAEKLGEVMFQDFLVGRPVAVPKAEAKTA